MTVNPTTAAGAATQAGGAAAAQKDELGRDAFMQLLVTQLRNQNPSEPQDSNELISQLATFSSLEKLTHIDDTINALALMLTQQAPGGQGGQE